MRRFLYIIKTFIAAVAIAFASTVSAVHVHNIISDDCSSSEVVHTPDDTRDCFLCLIVYQTHISEAPHTDVISSGLDTKLYSDAATPLKRFSFDWYGRAPPVSS